MRSVKRKTKSSKCGQRARVVAAELALLICKASFVAALLFISSCAGNDIFQPIGNNIASPLEMSIDSATARLYLVNSNNTVLYKNASLQVYDITTPTAPVLVGTAPTLNFSGHTYYDAASKYVFMTNRYSDQGNSDLIDAIIRVNVDEASPDFLSVVNYDDNSNPFGMTFDATSGNLYAAAYNSVIEYFSPAAPSNITAVSVANLNLSDGNTLGGSDMRDIAIIGRQAFVTIPAGGMFVFDLDENNVDYYVSDFLSPRAITTDGTYAIMTDVEQGDNTEPLVYYIDPAAFPPISGNTTATVKSRSDAGVIYQSIAVGADSNADPEELALSTKYLFKRAL